ncbi:MAG: LCP family protein, partial [Chloroflexota bacterium]|nr:LCP family protein [Chloroflexota bacterium]
NPYPIKDDSYPTPDFQYARVFFPAGIMHLDGAEALKYVRTRHDDSDFGRNARQQQVILSIREQAKQLNLLSHATDLIDTLGQTFRTDLPTNQWLGFAKFGIDLPSAAVQRFTLVDLIQTRTISGIDYDLIDWPRAVVRAQEFSPKENNHALHAAVPQTTPSQTTITAGGIATSGDPASLISLLLLVGLLTRGKYPPFKPH